VEYFTPGLQELAVAEVMKDHDLALLRNHGLVAEGKDLDSLLQKCDFF